MTDSGRQFVSKFFAALRTFMATKLFTTTEYHPQANDQVKSFNKTLVARLQFYIGEQPTSWDDYVQPLNYRSSTLYYKNILLQLSAKYGAFWSYHEEKK